MKLLLTILMVTGFFLANLPAAPTVSNVVATMTSYVDNGKGLKTRTYDVSFDLANTNGKTCRIWPGVRGVEKTPVLLDEGPWLWYKNLAGDTATAAGTGKHITFVVADTAGEFDNVRVRVTAWDRDGWPPFPNRPWNPRHHAWALDIRKAPVQSKSALYLAYLKANHTQWGCWQEHTVFTVMGNHAKQTITCRDYPSESDGTSQPIAHTSLGDPYNAYPEGNALNAGCDGGGGGDCHIETIDVENWINYGGWRFNKTGSAYPNDWSASNTVLFPLYSEVFTKKGAGAVPGSPPSTIGAYRTIGWTSGSAGGLAIPPGLIRLQDIADGEIQTALRFTTPKCPSIYVHPATHQATSTTDANAPPYGLRLRLKQTIDINTIMPLPPTTDANYRNIRAMRIVLRGWQKYGWINDDIGLGTPCMAERDFHTELKWANLMSADCIALMQYYFTGRDVLDLTVDFEAVDWAWEYSQYTAYEAKK